MTGVAWDCVGEVWTRGLAAFAVPPPMTLDAWARAHFYLSAESSYVEQAWKPWPFQRAIMACISHDDIREVDWIKAARVGNTKIMLAAIGYFAEHKRRNQAIWQPCDDDRDDFVKTELDPMLRDVPVMRVVFPQYLARHKDNTMLQKSFIGSKLHLRGGKAGKNYRRISIDVAYLDEIDGFDADVEKEGDPVTLAAKRIEGATFPKLVVGSTPKLAGWSLIEERVRLAEHSFEFVVPCIHCGAHHPIAWGGKDEPFGFKWSDHDPKTVRHLCKSCGALMSQGDYLAVWERGFYRSDDDLIKLDAEGNFTYLADGSRAPTPSHVAFVNIWTAYSPAANWSDIVADFLAAHAKQQQGDDAKLKTFTNTTLGRPWALDVDETEAHELEHRAEPYALGTVPMGGLILFAGVDTQDNRLEAVVWAFGRGSEMWCIDDQVLYGNPAERDVWLELDDYLERDFMHASGQLLKIHAAAIDSRGHNTQAVYEYCARRVRRRVFAIAGRSQRERAINDGATKIDKDPRGMPRKNNVRLWNVGTNLAKDLIYSRQSVTQPGPGYIHFSKDLSREFFEQFTGEQRHARITPRGRESRWKQKRNRVEKWDCTVYAVWLEHKFELARKSQKWWQQLEESVQPANADLFAPEKNTPPPVAKKSPGVRLPRGVRR